MHCRHGVSRSGAVVVAVAMQHHRTDYAVGLATVRLARPAICPNTGFQRQLELWHHMNFRLISNNLRYNLFLMDHNAMEGDFRDLEEVGDLLTLGRVNLSDGYRCAKCRVVLVHTAHIVPHSRERPVVWWEDSCGNNSSSYPPSCGQGLFVLKLPWMKADSGRLHCCYCDTKLGSIRLGAAIGEGGGELLSCPCGAKTTRGVWINIRKVDKFSLQRPC